jgi:hypothetical protein
MKDKKNEKPEKCQKCLRKAKYRLIDKKYCENCFSELIEQKIKQNLRKYALKKGCVLRITDAASEYVVKKVINLPVKIVRGKQKTEYEIIPWTTDDENETFLKMFFDNNKTDLETKKSNKKQTKKIINLFYPVSKKEMQQYLDIKRVKYNFKTNKINKIINNFEERFPGTKRALLKSAEKINAVS